MSWRDAPVVKADSWRDAEVVGGKKKERSIFSRAPDRAAAQEARGSGAGPQDLNGVVVPMSIGTLPLNADY